MCVCNNLVSNVQQNPRGIKTDGFQDGKLFEAFWYPFVSLFNSVFVPVCFGAHLGSSKVLDLFCPLEHGPQAMRMTTTRRSGGLKSSGAPKLSTRATLEVISIFLPLLEVHPDPIVAQCSATLASVVATPPCSTTPFQRQLDMRHPCQLNSFRRYSALPLLHLKNPRILRKSAASRVATRVARRGVPAHVCNYARSPVILHSTVTKFRKAKRGA